MRCRSVAVALLSLVLVASTGCKKRAPEIVDPTKGPLAAAKWTYYCSETKTWVQAPPEAVPAVNPKTGRKTLGLALYCDKCGKWIPVPPPPIHANNPLAYHCPIHHVDLKVEGPPPPANTP